MFKSFNRWKRRKLVESHVAKSGDNYDYFGVSVKCDPDADPSIKYLLLRNRYERPEGELITELVAPDTNIVELGGSLGIVSQYLRSRIGPEASHIIVEADPALAEKCRTATANDGKTDVVAAALAYGADHVRFEHGGGNAHIGRVMSGEATASGKNMIEVPAVTLEKLTQSFSANADNALVCDIEGAELDLMRNEGDLVAKMFDQIIFEFHPAIFEKNNSSEKAFFDLCDAKGLELVRKLGNCAAFTSRMRSALASKAESDSGKS